MQCASCITFCPGKAFELRGDHHPHHERRDRHPHRLRGDHHPHRLRGDRHPHCERGDRHPHRLTGDRHSREHSAPHLDVIECHFGNVCEELESLDREGIVFVFPLWE